MEPEEVKQFVEERFGGLIAAKKPVAELMQEVGTFLITNYDQMTSDAKGYADQLAVKFADVISATLPRLPDGKEKRVIARQIGQVQSKHFQAKYLARHLIDSPIGDSSVIIESETTFYGVLQRILDVLFDATRESSQGIPTMPLLALHYWCVDELLAAYHLSRHHFSTQA